MLRLFSATRAVRATAGPVSAARFYSMGAYEQQIYDRLKDKLNPTTLTVQDVSGGCGSMFAIQITSQDFKGLSLVKQHRLVNDILSDEIGKWHGLQLRTSAPKK